MIPSTMQRVPLSLNHILERAGRLYAESQIVSRRPDKSIVRHRFADFHRRARQLASALRAAGLRKGDRVATLCWNHYAHLECYFGIPAAGGVMHTLNLRLAPDEIGWIANHARDRFLIVDDILLPLYEQFRGGAPFEHTVSHRAPTLDRDDVKRFEDAGAQRIVILPWWHARDADEALGRLADSAL